MWAALQTYFARPPRVRVHQPDDPMQELRDAIAAKRWRAVRRLVDHGALVDSIVDRNGNTPLQQSASRGDHRAIERLIQLGADPNRPWPSGGSVLAFTMGPRSTPKCAWALLRGGAAVPTCANPDGSTLLHNAARGGDPKIIQELAAREVELGARELLTGWTALEAACALGNLRAVEALFKAGATIQPSEEGFPSPLQLAKDAGHSGVVDWLERAGAVEALPGLPPVRLRPPGDWNDAAGWDAYWRFELRGFVPPIRTKRPIAGSTWHEFRDGKLVPVRTFVGSDHLLTPPGDVAIFRSILALDRPVSVLVVGNGPSLLPAALAHAGHRVSVIDLSKVVIAFLSTLGAPRDQLEVFFVASATAGEFDLEAVRRPGGSLELLLGDIRSPTLANEDFQVIVATRSVQGYVGYDLEDCLDAISRRLTPEGELHIGAQNASAFLAKVEEKLVSRGFSREPGARRIHTHNYSG